MSRYLCLPLLCITLACANADEPVDVSDKPTASLSLSRIVLHENSVPTIELGDDGTMANLLASRPGPVIQHRCGPHVLQARFLRSDGQQEALISREHYLLDITTENQAVARFERWDQFAGNLQGRGVGTTRLRVTLVDLADSVTVFGPFNIPVEVQQVDRDPC